MEQIFLTNLDIKKVRHLENISIPLDKNKRKHLIFTGKNGSGKTSVLESMAKYFNNISQANSVTLEETKRYLQMWAGEIEKLSGNVDSEENRQPKVF